MQVTRTVGSIYKAVLPDTVPMRWKAEVGPVPQKQRCWLLSMPALEQEQAEHHCCCGHHHEEEHHHHHHDEDEHCCCGHHHEEEHHHHGHECGCGHHHDHHADEVFTSWGVETAKKFAAEDIHKALEALDSGDYGMILRAKGIVAATDGTWIHFDYVPEEHDIRTGSAAVIGKLCVIGADMKEQAVAALFGV